MEIKFKIVNKMIYSYNVYENKLSYNTREWFGMTPEAFLKSIGMFYSSFQTKDYLIFNEQEGLDEKHTEISFQKGGN